MRNELIEKGAVPAIMFQNGMTFELAAGLPAASGRNNGGHPTYCKIVFPFPASSRLLLETSNWEHTPQ
jgi:hypothetical protein